MVTILVGSQKHKFIAHKDFLTYYSEYFRACLGERFTEAENRVVELDHTEPEAFRHLMDWIYKQDIQSVAERQIEAIGASVQDVAGEYMDLWILADYLLIPELQNLVLEKLSEHKPAVLCPDVISHVYSNTGEGSMLRKFALDLSSTVDQDGVPTLCCRRKCCSICRVLRECFSSRPLVSMSRSPQEHLVGTELQRT